MIEIELTTIAGVIGCVVGAVVGALLGMRSAIDDFFGKQEK